MKRHLKAALLLLGFAAAVCLIVLWRPWGFAVVFGPPSLYFMYDTALAFVDDFFPGRGGGRR